jgi:hypothetical protein
LEMPWTSPISQCWSLQFKNIPLALRGEGLHFQLYLGQREEKTSKMKPV